MEILEVGEGSCSLRMTVKQDMTNGFGVAHGGISFAFSDSAFAFAINSRGYHAVSIECSISHVKTIGIGDILTAVATERSRGKTIGVYDITVTNQNDVIVALFRGVGFIKEVMWE
jgi:acyl-CoA thioesterase